MANNRHPIVHKSPQGKFHECKELDNTFIFNELYFIHALDQRVHIADHNIQTGEIPETA
jgi:hypothetical protein